MKELTAVQKAATEAKAYREAWLKTLGELAQYKKELHLMKAIESVYIEVTNEMADLNPDWAEAESSILLRIAADARVKLTEGEAIQFHTPPVDFLETEPYIDLAD